MCNKIRAHFNVVKLLKKKCHGWWQLLSKGITTPVKFISKTLNSNLCNQHVETLTSHKKAYIYYRLNKIEW